MEKRLNGIHREEYLVHLITENLFQSGDEHLKTQTSSHIWTISFPEICPDNFA